MLIFSVDCDSNGSLVARLKFATACNLRAAFIRELANEPEIVVVHGFLSPIDDINLSPPGIDFQHPTLQGT